MESVSDAEFISRAISIVKAADEAGVSLRLLGAIAFRVHCPKFEPLYKGLGRSITDIDLAAYGKQRNLIEKLLRELAYSKRPASLVTTYSLRDLYFDVEQKIIVDIFFDKLQMNHTIDLRDRLKVDYPTIPLAEMLLQKMQIVQLTEKDVKDTIVLLREHKVGDHDHETINCKYIAELLSKDWGFYYTVATNLAKVKALLQYDPLTDEDSADIKAKIDKILEAIEKKPKSLGWRMRSKLGTSKKWYRAVESAG